MVQQIGCCRLKPVWCCDVQVLVSIPLKRNRNGQYRARILRYSLLDDSVGRLKYSTRALKCETLGAILHCLVSLALMLALCFLSCSRLCTVCSLVSVAPLAIWLGQANCTRRFYTCSQDLHTFSLGVTLWAYLARRHDQQQHKPY